MDSFVDTVFKLLDARNREGKKLLKERLLKNDLDNCKQFIQKVINAYTIDKYHYDGLIENVDPEGARLIRMRIFKYRNQGQRLLAELNSLKVIDAG